MLTREADFLNKKVDLHMHSTYSDGSNSVDQLIELAHKNSIGLISLTDHDTISGLKEARSLANKKNIFFINGVELSSEYSNGACHILGYFIDEENDEFNLLLKRLQENRQIRNKLIIKKLQDLGIDISYEELKESVTSSTTIGRLHIADLLVKKSVVKRHDQAFKRLLGSNGKAYVKRELLKPKQAIKYILDAGGWSFIAHPVSLKLFGDRLDKFFLSLKDVGLTGIEIYNSAHRKNEHLLYKKIALKYDLKFSGGSDFHGTIKPNLQIGHACKGGFIYGDQISYEFWKKLNSTKNYDK